MLDIPYLNKLIDDLSAHDIAPEQTKALRQAIEELDTLRRKVQLAAEALGAKLPTDTPPGRVEYTYDCAICRKHHTIFVKPGSRPKYCLPNEGELKSECQRKAARRKNKSKVMGRGPYRLPGRSRVEPDDGNDPFTPRPSPRTPWTR